VSDMVEAGARALFEHDPPTLRGNEWTWDTAIGPAEYLRENRRVNAFIVLEGAFNPENEAVIESLARRLHDANALKFGLPKWDQHESPESATAAHNRFRARAKETLAILLDAAQGET